MKWKVINNKEEFKIFDEETKTYSYISPTSYPCLAISHIKNYKAEFGDHNCRITEVKDISIVYPKDFPDLFFKAEMKELLK